MSKGKEKVEYSKLIHNGIFVGFPYEPIPNSGKFTLDGKEIDSKDDNNEFRISQEEALQLFTKAIIARCSKFNKGKGKKALKVEDKDVLASAGKILKAIDGKKKNYSHIDNDDIRTLILDETVVNRDWFENFLDDFNKIRTSKGDKKLTLDNFLEIDFEPFCKFWEKDYQQRQTTEYKKELNMRKAIVKSHFSPITYKEKGRKEENSLINKQYSAQAPNISTVDKYLGRISRRYLPSDFTLNLVNYNTVPKPMIWDMSTNSLVPYKYDKNKAKQNTSSTWSVVDPKKSVAYLATFSQILSARPGQIKTTARSKKDPNKYSKSFQIYITRNINPTALVNDKNKFEGARHLNKYIDQVREFYDGDFEKGNKSFATALYLLDTMSIRPGDSKERTEEGDTQGLLDLTCNNLKFGSRNSITFEFKGKSGVVYKETHVLDQKYYDYLKDTICKGKGSEKKLFELATSPKSGNNAKALNKYISEILVEDMEEDERYYLKKFNITSKTFRTRIACYTLEKYLDDHPIDMNAKQTEKKDLFVKANMAVSKILNHKSLAGNITKSLAKAIQSYNGKSNIMKLENEDIEFLKNIIDTSDTNVPTVEKSEENIIHLNALLEQIQDKDNTKLAKIKDQIALGTATVNYIDPRIVVAWCKKVDFEIEKCYQTAVRKKFKWAMTTKSNWNFSTL